MPNKKSHPIQAGYVLGAVAAAICFGIFVVVWPELQAAREHSDVPAVPYQVIKNGLPKTPPPVQETPSAPSAPTPAPSPAFPTSFNLAVPFTSQAPEKNWDEPWQDACEEASALMLDGYYKNYLLPVAVAKEKILALVSWEEQKNWGVSIPAADIAIMLRTKFFSNKTVRVITDPTILQIKTLIAHGNPVLIVADGKELPNPHYRAGGPIYHALVIRGYTPTQFITNDPGTQFGENFLYNYSDLMNAIHDWNDGDVPNGKHVVLVVE